MVQQEGRGSDSHTTGTSHFVAGACNNQGHYNIRLPRDSWFKTHGVVIPSYVWRTPKFIFRPNDYVLDHPKLNRREIEGFLQLKSLAAFIENPAYPGVYGVASDPNDNAALYFAAYLVACFVSAKPRANIKWHSLSGYRNTLLEDGTPENLDLLIVTHVTAQNRTLRLETLRDLLVKYADIPRVVVIGGEDPVTFFATRLHFKLTHLFFNSGPLAKRTIEVI